MDRLKIVSLNVGKRLAAVGLLDKEISDYDIIAVQEPYVLTSGKVSGFSSRNTVIQKGARTALAVTNRSLNYFEVLKMPLLVGIIISGINDVLVITCYFPPMEAQGPIFQQLQDVLIDTLTWMFS